MPDRRGPNCSLAISHPQQVLLARLILAIAACLAFIGCSAGTPTTTFLRTVAPSIQAELDASTPPSLAPSPSLTPGPEARLTFGKLTYSSDACFMKFRDPQGHAISGIEGRFALAIQNPTKAIVRDLWLVLLTTDGYGSNPTPTTTSWTKDAHASGDASSLTMPAPAIHPGTSHLRWGVLFATALAPHYTLSVVTDPNSTATSELTGWSDMWTSVSLC